MKNLVIVESPTKAKTIAKYLGKGYAVLSSFGHVRDLPRKQLGIDVEKDFAPKYVVPTKAKTVVAELKKAAAKADAVYFASDHDREGEAIAWHLKELLDLPKQKTRRIFFHEITEEAIKKALTEPRDIDDKMVDAQQARRILDRLVGYRLSPFLWRKVARGLSAGRVQSVVVRLVVEREREIRGFVPREYWSVEATLARIAPGRGPGKGAEQTFVAKLNRRDGETLDKFALADTDAAGRVVADLDGAEWKVVSVERKTVRRSPSPPFTTSTLQQEGNNRLGYSAKQTMIIAQQLYEGVDLGSRGPVGLITYMRTDSVNLSDKFLTDARAELTRRFGKDALPDEPRRYKTKAKGAQEAHEAIRPTDITLHPDDVKEHLDDRQLKLYDLIWRRAAASQMTDAELLTVSANIDAAPSTLSGRKDAPLYGFRAAGSNIVKHGFMVAYETESELEPLPELSENAPLDAKSVEPKQHFTEPLPNYTEASIVKTLEENGIGRPSTYAPTISTVVDRGYVVKDGRKLKPTDLAFLVNDLLVEHFPTIVDYQFTAKMEEDLDRIAEGKCEWVPIIAEFYGPFQKLLAEKEKEVSKKEVTEEATDEKCDKCGKPMIIKMGRFGKFLACTGFPECRNTRNQGEPPGGGARIDEKCEKCGAPMMIKRGRFGEFLSCSKYPECKTVKPLQKKVGVQCPACGKGDIVEKRTRKGKIFYACSLYPECKNAMWSRPTGDVCPACGGLLVLAKGNTVKCSNKGCTYERNVEKG